MADRSAGQIVDIRALERAWQIVGIGSAGAGVKQCRVEKLERIVDPSKPSIVEKRIGLEVSLTSNVHISAVTDYAAHPLKDYLQHGIVANLNTDDPAISGIDLRHEYEVAAPRAGLGPEQIRKTQEYALEMAFLSDEDKRTLKAALRAS